MTGSIASTSNSRPTSGNLSADPYNLARSSSVSTSDLLAQLLSSGMDVAMLFVVEQMIEGKQELNANLCQVRQLGEWREAVNGRLDELRRIKSIVGELATDENTPVDTAKVIEKLQQFIDANPQLKNKYGDAQAMLKQQEILLGNDGNVHANRASVAIGGEKDKITVNGVDAQIKALEDQAATISLTREMTNMKTQEGVQRNERLTVMLSNLSKSLHNGKSTIVRNLA